MAILYKLFFTTSLFLVALTVHAEEITHFSSVLNIRADGTVLVTENITYDFGGTQRHGIFRFLEKRHPQESTAWYKKRSIGIEVVNVQQDGFPVPFEVTHSSTEVNIKIGDPNLTVIGPHIYTITYLLEGALSYGEMGSEFYYNVTGNGWDVPITKVSAMVVDDSRTLLDSQSACYQGDTGDTTSCTKGTVTDVGVFFDAVSLAPYEGLTIAQSLHAENVAVLIHEKISLNGPFYILGCIWIIGLMVWAYRYRTHFKSKKPVIAQYEPYEGILPMYTGVVLDGRLDPQDITAGIVYLAEQGFIKIRKTEEKVLWIFDTTDYEFTLLKPVPQDMVPMLQEITSFLFSKSNEADVVVKMSVLVKDKKENYAFLQKLQKITAESLTADGFLFETFDFRSTWQRPLGVAVVMFVGLLFANKIFITIVIISSLSIFGLAIYKRRTAKGYDVQNHLKGFKLYLSVTEKERYTFFNAPEKSPELFMKYLPYAIAFKVEKQWAKAFEGITIPNPSWYEGGAMNAFSATALSSDIGAFSSSFSASSGISGSSGGGSSGGGGGGGGGGSW